ncbi:MAG: PAS domain-containing sensor histidine kinase [Cyclobacteriaceae bacterium]|nr:PAS domain-containing sensor histidine kinase [Cyclobacteriaceae bacterium]
MQKEKKQVSGVIEMINAMTRFDFSKQQETNRADNSMNLLAQSLNTLNKELEANSGNNKTGTPTTVTKEASDYKYALDQSAIVVITDTKGTIEYVNELFCKISHYSKEELLGKNQRIVSSGYHPKAFWKEMWAVIGKGKVWRNEIKNKAKDGTYYWVDTTIVPFVNNMGKPIQYMAIRHDITATKQREQELIEALKQVSDYKYALDQSAIVAITDTNGNIEYANEMFCKISQYSEKELLGKNQRIVNSGYHPKAFWKEMWDTIGKGEVWRSEVKNKERDGSYHWLDTTIIPFVDANGKPERYMAIRHEITDKKQRQEELKQYRQKLEKANENLEKFAYTAAHDMKSPLNSAMGLIDIIAMELKGKENGRTIEYLDLLKDTFNNTKQLINGILEYSKTGFSEIALKNIDLNILITKIANRYSTGKQTLPANRPVKIKIAQKMPIVRHYKTALSQIIDNLISNAVKYNDKKICEIYIECIDKSTHYEISIADNGPGIADEYKEKIFDLFENLKTKKKSSSGIGLAIVKKLLTETNGRIWVDTVKKQGANFVFTIDK